MAKDKYDTLTKLYQTISEKKNEETANVKVPTAHSEGGPIESCDHQPDFSNIIQYTIPRKMQRKAIGLIQFLQQHGDNVIKWNQRGQVTVNGEVIEASHIVDLLRDAVCPKTVHRPSGYQKFYQALKTIDTPRALIANVFYTDIHNGKQTLSQTGGGYVVERKTNGPPPGYSPPMKTSKTEIKWLKF